MSDSAGGVELRPIRGVGEVRPGEDLAAAILAALDLAGIALVEGDILVVTQKIVSKAENCIVSLADVRPGPFARQWSEHWGTDPRVVELVLAESRRIVRMERGIIIAETSHGLICANAGIDCSNVGPDLAALLPPDPDASAARLRDAFQAHSGVRVGVIISDTFGRPWREGQTDAAIGVAGVESIRHYQGQHDPAGYELRVTETATADEIASAAELVMGKLDRVPVALIRGLGHCLGNGTARDMVRPPERDIFR